MADGRTRRRSLAGLAAALGWLLGLYVLPLAHNLDHQDDHTHGPAERDDHHHSHDDPRPHPVPIDSDHGAGSVLHFAVAGLGSQAPALPDVGAVILPPDPPSPPPPPSIPLRTVLARGPPAASLL